MHYGKAVSVPSNSCSAQARTPEFRLNFVLANYVDVFEPDQPILYNYKAKFDVQIIWSTLGELLTILITFPTLLNCSFVKLRLETAMRFWLRLFKDIYNLLQSVAITDISQCAPVCVIIRIFALPRLQLSPAISHHITPQTISKPKYSTDKFIDSFNLLKPSGFFTYQQV